MNRRKLVSGLLVIVSVTLLLCSFSFFKPELAVDTETEQVYKYIPADTIITDFNNDEKKARNDYYKKPLVISGRIESIDQKNFKLTIIGNQKYDSIYCSFDKKTGTDFSGMKTGDQKAVYGTFSYDLISEKMQISAEKIVDAPVVKSQDVYYTLDGSSFDRSGAYEQTLAGGRVKYYISPALRKTELNIPENGLGSIEGYQYVLNKNTDHPDSTPESLFVCYFDRNQLKTSSDIKSTELVEKAIIENIEGSVGRFPSYRTVTYYDAEYQYYTGKYTDSALGKGYRTEYIFQKDGDNGIVMFLYLYREKNYISDVLFTARFMTTGV